MKNTCQKFRIFILIFLLFISSNSFAQQIKKVGAGEYITTYLTTGGRLYITTWTSSGPAIRDLGLSNIVDVDGAQYSNVALNSSGEVYVVGANASGVPYANAVPTDNLGNPFNNNSHVYGLYQSYLTIRNGNVWYWGTDDILNMNNGAVVNAPMQLTQPTDKIMVKLVATSATTFGALTFVWGLASDGTVWQWDRTHSTPFQVTFPGNSIAKDIAMIGPMAFVVLTEHDMYTWGYDPTYAGGISRWIVPGIQSVRSKWEDAGVVFPIKEMVGNQHTLHIIDANNNFFASGANPQGNIGNGIQTNPWREHNWAWDWLNGELLTDPVQIPGKVKNICTGNTITFYLYVQDMGGNWYSWGRNKALSLGNGKTLSINASAVYPDAINVPAPTPVSPLTQTWTVVPFDPNEVQPPMANAGINQYIQTGTTTLFGQGSSQQDGNIVSYMWSKLSGGNVNIVSPHSVNTSVTGLEEGVYIFQLTVTNNLSRTSTAEVKVIVSLDTTGNKVNLVVEAGPDKTIFLPENIVTLSGSVPDSSGTFASYRWIQLAGPQGANIQNNNRLQTNVTGLTAGVYLFQLTGTDDIGNVATDRVTVTVISNTPPNIAPTANAGADKEVQLPTNSVRVVGTGADSDGTIVSYQWTILSGPTGASILNSSNSSASVVGLREGEYYVSLTVTDNDGATGSDTMKITVLPAPPPNIAPTANAGADKEVQLPTNSVRVVGTGVDSDGTIVSYQWTILSGPTGASILNSSDSSASVVGLREGEYYVSLTVTDNDGATGSDTMKITVLPAPPPNIAPTANAGADKEVQLPTNSVRVVGTGADSDGTIVSYQWTILSGPTGASILNSSNSSASVVGLREGEYYVSLTVTDNDGATGSDTMKITVLPAPPPNIAPTANAGADVEIYLPNSSVQLDGSGTDLDGTVVGYLWTLLSGPAGATIVDHSDPLTSITGLQEGMYLLELKVTDNLGAEATSVMRIMVYPDPDYNIPPIANAGTDVEVWLPSVSTGVNGTGTDADGVIVRYQWSQVSGLPATIVNPNIGRTHITGLVEGSYIFRLTVMDNMGATGYDDVVVNVVNPGPNATPRANAGPDRYVYLPVSSVKLWGWGMDIDGSVLSYQWSKISGPGNNRSVAISNARNRVPEVSGLKEGIYQFELQVKDNMGAISRDTMSVIVIGREKYPELYPVSTDTDPYFSVYPNPVVSSFWVKLSGFSINEKVEVSLFSLQGIKLKSQVFTVQDVIETVKMEAAKLNTGVYIIEVSNGRVKRTGKLVKK